MMTAAIVLFYVLGVISSIHSVMSTRTSQGSIAWAVSLVTIPYIAVPAYWIFGRNKFQSYIDTRRKSRALSEQIERQVTATVERFRVGEGSQAEAARAGEALAGLPAMGKHDVELLIDGKATFDSILSGIDVAREYVLFQFYIIHDDEIGREVKKHLLAKAAEGVRVYFLYDEIGSIKLPRKYLSELRDGGVETTEFDSSKGPTNRFQINFRNHRKIVVVDGRVAWIGGHNVGDEYLGRDPKFGPWRDTHVRIEGPAVLSAQISFAEDWYWATNSLPDFNWTGQPAANGSDLPVLIIASGPADELETASLMFVHAINSAKRRIWIASPYFVPDDAIILALQLAGHRGVDVRILIPDKADSLLVYLAAFSFFDQACQTGAEFYRYQKGFLHQKVMLIDDDVATIGTANFDNRSFRLNFEITAAVSDAKFVAEVEQMLETDFENSRLLAQGQYDRQKWWFKLGSRLARLLAPIL